MLLLPAIPIGNKTIRLPISDRDAVSLIAALGETDTKKRNNRITHLLITSPTFFVGVAGFGKAASIKDWNELREHFTSIESEWVEQWADDADDTQIDFEPLISATATVLKLLRKCFKSRDQVSAEKIRQAYADLIVATGMSSHKKAKRWIDNQLAGFAFEEIHFLATEKLKKKEIVNIAGAWYYAGHITNGTLRSLLTQKKPNQHSLDQNSIWDEKLAAMKQLAYGASHEINNPLGNIASRAQMLAAKESNEDLKRHLSTIYQQAMRAHEMISDLMLFAHPPALEIQKFSLNAAVAEIRAYLSETSSIELLLSNDLEISGDRGQISAMIQAMVQNAVEADASTVTIQAEQAGSAKLTITDDGSGVSEQAARHLFDPFYSGREAGRGLGFGLSKAWRVAELHGGSLRLKSSKPGETIFVVALPQDQ